MLKALPLIVLVTLSAPALAVEPSVDSQIAQQQQAPQPAPKRDCERRQEGVGT
jgi:hypothetical protein